MKNRVKVNIEIGKQGKYHTTKKLKERVASTIQGSIVDLGEGQCPVHQSVFIIMRKKLKK